MNRTLIASFFSTLVLFGQNAMCQDERFFREAFSGKFKIKSKIQEAPKYNWKTNSPLYAIDLTGNGKKEGIIFEKKDSEDWVHIHDSSMKKVFSYPLEARGFGAWPYKVSIRAVSKNIKVILIHYFEGKIQTIDYKGTSRLYLLTIKDGDLSTLTMTKGPALFIEEEKNKKSYIRRTYNVSLFDYDFDGFKEVAIKYHVISRVLVYSKDDNTWKIN